ncbi:hypothetical protein [Siccibacter colletis]|uniref:hypothetical protein n=1 Tax=Siccibacter colletis TaxID=1505757 RepID=UPI003CEA86DD
MSLTPSSNSKSAPHNRPVAQVFVHADSGHVFANASLLNGEWTARWGTLSLEKLRRIYPDMTLMTIAECARLQNEKFRTPWVEVTSDRYVDQLEVVHPVDWCDEGGVASFKSSEMHTDIGEITSIFVRKAGRFFECRDVCTLTHQEIIAAVTEHFFAGESVNSGH